MRSETNVLFYSVCTEIEEDKKLEGQHAVDEAMSMSLRPHIPAFFKDNLVAHSCCFDEELSEMPER